MARFGSRFRRRFRSFGSRFRRRRSFGGRRHRGVSFSRFRKVQARARAASRRSRNVALKLGAFKLTTSGLLGVGALIAGYFVAKKDKEKNGSWFWTRLGSKK